MRILVFLMTAVIGTVACAETSVFYAERGHWSVALGGKTCRALNRPPEDFNAAPYNALQIVARTGGAIGVEVFFWPGAVNPSASYRLRLDFSASDTVTVAATAGMGDFMLASADEPKLWRFIQFAKTIRAKVEGESLLELSFGLDDVTWVLNNLQNCARLLPKP